jgi:hypothetical protein
MLAGPNGSGKSSLFDAFDTRYRYNSSIGTAWDPSYHKRTNSPALAWHDRVSLEFHTPLPALRDQNRSNLFYFRTAYRNEPDLSVSTLGTAQPLTTESRFSRMIESDIAVSLNYRRLASQALADVFQLAEGSTTIRDFRESVIGEIRDAILRLFPKGITVQRLIDRDDHSETDVRNFRSRGIRVLIRRHLQSYLFDDEVLQALCQSLGREADLAHVLADKQAELAESCAGGNPSDDLKSASGPLYNRLRIRLSFRALGNDARSFARSTLAPLLRPGLATYEDLKASIFHK